MTKMAEQIIYDKQIISVRIRIRLDPDDRYTRKPRGRLAGRCGWALAGLKNCDMIWSVSSNVWIGPYFRRNGAFAVSSPQWALLLVVQGPLAGLVVQLGWLPRPPGRGFVSWLCQPERLTRLIAGSLGNILGSFVNAAHAKVICYEGHFILVCLHLLDIFKNHFFC